MSRGERKAMITREHPDLNLSRHCRLLSISRSSFYYAVKGESPEKLALMRRIDELFLKYPFYGSRQMVRQLRREGVRVGRHRVRRLMRLMGLQAIYQAPRTSMPHPAHRIYPYLLRGLSIDRPNQVWCADITYIPVQRGFLYLVAIMDWTTRHVLSWRLSNTMDAGFSIDALKEALTRYGKPEIFNTDQGSQFTSFDFTGVLKDAGIAISMDGRGRCMDNIFIERLWRSLKYEAVYLHELTDGFKAERVNGEWIDFYNTERPHSATSSEVRAATTSDGDRGRRVGQTAGNAQRGQGRTLGVVGQRDTADFDCECSKSALGFDAVDGAGSRRISDQADLGGIEPQSRQSHGGRHVGVLGVQRCRVTRRSSEKYPGLVERIQVDDGLGGCILPGFRRFRHGLAYGGQSPKSPGCQRIDATQRTGWQQNLRFTATGRRLQAIEKVLIGQGPNRND